MWMQYVEMSVLTKKSVSLYVCIYLLKSLSRYLSISSLSIYLSVINLSLIKVSVSI